MLNLFFGVVRDIFDRSLLLIHSRSGIHYIVSAATQNTSCLNYGSHKTVKSEDVNFNNLFTILKNYIIKNFIYELHISLHLVIHDIVAIKLRKTFLN